MTPQLQPLEQGLRAVRSGSRAGILSEPRFHAALRRECRRAERSEKPFLLALASLKRASAGQNRTKLDRLAAVLAAAFRETDIVGWSREGHTLGVVFTELGATGRSVAPGRLEEKLRAAARAAEITEERLHLRLQLFPVDANAAPWPRRARQRHSPAALAVKRAIDVAGSALGLLALSPFFLMIAALIKLTSTGPVLYRQTRLGQHGGEFTFLKFRSMYEDSDAALHKEYVSDFIAGKAQPVETGDGKAGAYKVVDDPRVTPLGRVLRKTSIDELPQLINVLRGEMSLVGPRPPLPYEYARYDTWHLRRITEVKPGITGLWQVYGRSTTTFDEMVRMDLWYAKSWSLSLDARILLRTFRVVFSGDGAY